MSVACGVATAGDETAPEAELGAGPESQLYAPDAKRGTGAGTAQELAGAVSPTSETIGRDGGRANKITTAVRPPRTAKAIRAQA